MKIKKIKKKKILTKEYILKTIQYNQFNLKKFKVKKLGLFGSFLKGKQHKKSDLDFLVKFDETTFDNYMDLKFLLEKLFHKKVDLVIEDNLKPALQQVKKEVKYVKGL